MDWIDFDEDKYNNQQLPKERRRVLLQIAAKPKQGMPPAVVVGYLRYSAGCSDSPYFVTPGVIGDAIAWCDCLGNNFSAPLWQGKQVLVED